MLGSNLRIWGDSWVPEVPIVELELGKGLISELILTWPLFFSFTKIFKNEIIHVGYRAIFFFRSHGNTDVNFNSFEKNYENFYQLTFHFISPTTVGLKISFKKKINFSFHQNRIPLPTYLLNRYTDDITRMEIVSILERERRLEIQQYVVTIEYENTCQPYCRYCFIWTLITPADTKQDSQDCRTRILQLPSTI